MDEKFVLLPFDSKYAVSDKGNIINVRSGRPLHTVLQNGYVRVQISTNGVRKNYPVHRLVATAFIKNEECKPYVNHKDGNKENNSAGVTYTTRNKKPEACRGKCHECGKSKENY